MKRIYIEGDLGSPRSLRVMDADTGKEMVNILSMSIHVASTEVQATMVVSNSAQTVEAVTAEVVPAPEKAGKFFQLGVQKFIDQRTEDIRFTLQSFSFAGGRLQEIPAEEFRINHRIDQQLALAQDPQVVYEHAYRSCGGMIGEHLAMYQFGKKLSGELKKNCPECHGTGQWENPISGQKTPCSMGCKSAS